MYWNYELCLRIAKHYWFEQSQKTLFPERGSHYFQRVGASGLQLSWRVLCHAWVQCLSPLLCLGWMLGCQCWGAVAECYVGVSNSQRCFLDIQMMLLAQSGDLTLREFRACIPYDSPDRSTYEKHKARLCYAGSMLA